MENTNPTSELPKDIEEEVNKLLAQEHKDGNGKSNKKSQFDLDIDFNEYDEIFDIKDDLSLPEVEIDKKEINTYMQIYDAQVEKEVEEELIKTFKPSTFEGDEKRAEVLLQKDDLIKEAVDTKIISKEELIMFIDYYELFSLMNKCRRFTLEELKRMQFLSQKKEETENENEDNDEEDNEEDDDEEGEDEESEEDDDNNDNTNKQSTTKDNEDDEIQKLMNDIESKLTVSETILANRLDYDKLLFHQGEFITEVPKLKQTATTNNNNNNTNNNNSNNKTEIKVKSINPLNTHNPLKKSNGFKHNSNTLKPIENTKLSINAAITQVPKFTSSNGFIPKKSQKIGVPFSTRQKLTAPTRSNIELFNDNAQATNLLKVRNDRKEMVKLRMQKQGSKLKELFKFDGKITKEENQKIREKFQQLYDLPSQFLESQNIDPLRKSTLRKKIEEAQNYFRNKNNNKHK